MNTPHPTHPQGMPRFSEAWSLLFILSIALSATAADLPPGAPGTPGTPGIVSARPAGEPRSAANPAGTYVEITAGPHAGRFMVPYTHTIRVYNNQTVEMKFTPIPGGVTTIGSPAGEAKRDKSEGPQVPVAVDPFWIGVYEVTWDQYDPYAEAYNTLLARDPTKLFVQGADVRRADAVSIPTPIFAQDALPIIDRMGRKGGYPMGHESQFGARKYTEWLSRYSGCFFRIPTEAEWEHAARAGTTTAYFWGDDPKKLDDYAWYESNSQYKDGRHGHPKMEDFGYHPVGLKRPNPWGLYDIYGNQAEWCVDQHEADWYSKLAAKADGTGGKPVPWAEAIRWPEAEYGRILRGGHWFAFADDCRSAARMKCEKQWKELDPQGPQSVWYFTEFWFGFRVVRPLHEPDAATRRRFWDPDNKMVAEYMYGETKQARMIIKPQPAE